MTHICVDNLTIIGSDNGLSPGRRQTIIWTNAWILLIGPLGANFSEMLFKIHTFSFRKMYSKMSSEKKRPFCLGLNVLTIEHVTWWSFYPQCNKLTQCGLCCHMGYRSGSTLAQALACCRQWTNDDLSSLRWFGIRLRALSEETLKVPISPTRLKLAFFYVVSKSHRGQWVKNMEIVISTTFKSCSNLTKREVPV